MIERKNWSRLLGLFLHILIGRLMIVTGSEKLLRLTPSERLANLGLGEQVHLLGAGALLTAVLLLIPRTTLFGTLLTSSFWGGAICIHMAHGEHYLFQTVLLVLSWTGAFLRNPVACSRL
jgi:hypothetical protein